MPSTTMNLADITPLVLTFNEERNIERTLRGLAWAHRIVIVDSHSTDRTVELVRRDPRVVVVQRAFDTHATQWNFGLDNIRTPWVLTLDADYVCPASLADELRALTPQAADCGFDAHFQYCIGGRPLRRSVYPPRVVLFRVTAARYRDDGHTQQLVPTGAIGHLRSIIDHDDRKPVDVWFGNQRRYAQKEALKLTSAPAHHRDLADRVRRTIVVLPLVMPWYCLIYKGLLLEGPRGWIYAAQRTYAELLVSYHLLRRDVKAIIS